MSADQDHPDSADQATRLADTSLPRVSTDTSALSNTSPTTSGTATTTYEAIRAEPYKSVSVGSVLNNRFVLEELLGRGGMGVVYKARDMRKVEAMDRDPYIAVKVLSKDFQANPDSFIALQRESKKAQQLAHPNIITVYDFDRDGANVFMTMELLEGEPLDLTIKRLRPGTLPQPQAISFIQQMSRALAYAHSEKIVHSDFKPGNVFVTSKNVVKVVDFGIARAAKSADRIVDDATVFDPGSLGALTPTYASCEMLEQQDPDPRDDVYGLAVVAYELLVGKHPFERKPATYARDLGMKAEKPKDVSKEIWQAISHGLEFEREKRTPDATQFIREMSGPRSGRDAARPKWLIPGAIAAGILFLSLGGLLIYDSQTGDQPPPVVLEDTASLSGDLLDRVQSLLEVAEVHELVGRDIDPPGSSAYDAYQQILALHPNNREAHDGIQRLGDHLAKVIQEQADSGDTRGAEALLQKALEKIPDNPSLNDLQDTL
ncbi:MAG: protein kinase [Candidatus Thiodiazotropha sp.]